MSAFVDRGRLIGIIGIGIEVEMLRSRLDNTEMRTTFAVASG